MHTHLGFPNTDSNLVIVGNNPQSMNNFLPSNTNSNTNSIKPKKFKYKKQYRELKQQFEELECEYYDNQVLYDEANNRIVELQEHNNLVEEQYNQIAEQYKQLTEEYNEFKENFEYHMMENGQGSYCLNDINYMEETIESLTNQVNYIGQDYDIVIEEMKVQEEEIFKLREANISKEKELYLEKNESQKLRQQNLNIITERNKYQSQLAELTEQMNDNIELVSYSKKLDWEVELGIVIGKETKNIEEKDAPNHILGYCIVNDLSEREWQIEKLGQWVKGKSHDTFGPIGPYLVTSDEIPNVNNLNLSLDVNGENMQKGNTNNMIFNVNFITAYLSKFMSLQEGDIITTGTPPGVGMGRKPQIFLKSGDTMRLSIDNLGEQNSKVVTI